MTETAMPVFDGHNDLLLRLWLHASVVVALLDATDRAALALVRKVRNSAI